ncbi:Cold-shock protein, DNA-binding domain protein [Candidatus Magnetomorum sp. HK-1]|nr:Cold-shock protein, DNA-binding domain protein [Candidatus Magnetomorum sp. HK-1]
MKININAVKKNLGTYTHAYGLKTKSEGLLQVLRKLDTNTKNIGLLFRDPITKLNLINCRFPVDADFTNQMLWTPINDRNLEVVPTFSRYKPCKKTVKWKKLNDEMGENSHSYDLVKENNFVLLVHRSFRTKGVIEKYNPKTGYGFIRRNRRDIFFISSWCKFNPIYTSMEVSFLPIISKKGLQARTIEPVKF